jgi:glycosyltransferase involved in cell wall biosynthesis
VPPLVSVVIPVHDTPQFLPAAVASVLRQTHTDLELIVVDDGSEQPAEAVLRADPRLRVVRREMRGGPSAARNDGWRRHANPTAAYVAFLDADDEWGPGKLAEQVAALEAAPACVAVGALMRYVATDGRELGIAGEAIRPDDRTRIAGGDLQPFQLSSLLVRRGALAQAGGFDEPLGLIGSEDLDLLARLAALGEIATVPHVLGSYRIHAASAMARHRQRINRGARFVRRRIDARRRGSDLTWEAFLATETVTWRDRRRDAVERCYRRAALGYADRRLPSACAYGLLAAAIDPAYTVQRFRRQFFARARRTAERLA